ncbi:TonB-dependent receptor domain-containing protein [Marinobacter zhanjiangensis]|uniref:Outer membrane receptor n=1 Tax=Marinobacter zhanjiangensis TaxID=578215 RepID=A0ABQ3AZS7_9GAMM|nr:TonB-dependent receptor [Marinobacter zhanjiangensis]GGY73015.1 outer membrane receptor [Marinobacter zhanjiangensis]
MYRPMTLLASAVALANAGAALAQSEPAELDEIVVTASGFEQNISDAPASISVIPAQELQKRSYTDITDAVKSIPGVYVNGGGNARDITIRGMTEGYTLYLVDGRPVSAGRNINTNGSDGGKQIALPPVSAIERIEVIRGPMSSLYGSEAMGGVINIITKKTTREWSGSVTTEYTKSLNEVNEDSQLVSAYASGALVPGLLGLQVDGFWQGTDESHYIGGDDSAESTPDSDRRQGGATLIFTPDDRNEIEVGYNTAELEYTHNPGVSIPELDLRGNPSEANTYTYHKDVYQIGHRGTYGNLTLDSYLQHDISERVQDLKKREEITTLNSQGTYLFGRHIVTFGGQYKYEDLTDETNGLLGTGVPTATSEVDRWIGALFTEIEWAVLDDLNVTTGIRYNEDELFGGHWTPRVYANYQMTPEWTFKGGVSTGYKQPSLPDATEGFGRPTGRGSAINIGNEDLEPETSTSYEAGFVFSSRATDLDASAMVFYTEFDDKIAEERLCQGPAAGFSDPSARECDYFGTDYFFVGTRKNIDEATMQGMELSLDYGITPALIFSSSYTYTDSEQKTGEFAGEPLNKIPKHMANAGLDWQSTNRLNLWLDANYRGETTDYLSRTSMDDGTPDYTFVDVGMVYQLNDSARVKAGLYNVADKEVTNDTYGVVLDGRRVNLGLTVDF